ncbi:MAG: ATP-dependent helicase HrpB [Thermodesulfobacteriota bacterium]
MTADLPVVAAVPSLAAALAGHGAAVLTAPPGSGKTTCLPLMLLDQLAGGRIVMLEPRRLAARAAAMRMAELIGEEVGATVGYQVRFERRISAACRIEVVTEGILTRRLQDDPGLEGVDLVIFDEFHERSLHADLALALCLEIRRHLRPELRILVMSATLQTEPLAALLEDAPVIMAAGRQYPVEVRHYWPAGLRGRQQEVFQDNRTAAISALVRQGVGAALAETRGDLLVFLPGLAEIRMAAAGLAEVAAQGVSVRPLHGDLSFADQKLAILPDPGGGRRVVLATNIAETSLTIEGIGAVVDSGWQRLSRFRPESGLSGLETARISRMSMEQRCGRAGRLGPGVCYRLWPEEFDGLFRDADPPEILQTDLASLLLDLSLWGAKAEELRWLDPPPVGALAQARELLLQLGALDTGGITELGRRMAAMPLHPRLAAMLLEGKRIGQPALAATLAALLSERDVLAGDTQRATADIEARLHRLRTGSVDSACRRVLRSRDELLRLTGSGRERMDERLSGLLLAHAYPDRIAQRRPESRSRYLLASGRGASLRDDDPLAGALYLAIAGLHAGAVEGRIVTAAALGEDELLDAVGDRLEQRREISWNSDRKMVEAYEETRCGSIVLSRKPLAGVGPEELAAALLAGIRLEEGRPLPWNDQLRQLQARLLSLCRWQPDEGWPDASDGALLDGDVLLPWLAGKRRLEELRDLDLAAVLTAELDWPMRRALDQLAPERLTVPSGSQIRLRYAPDGSPPVLAVRIQEMFGAVGTPAVCRGQVAVVLHLLSPAGRPMQVTTDLGRFWREVYPEVKKELKGRYPKHHWPDDPLSAAPTARAKTRGARGKSSP